MIESRRRALGGAYFDAGMTGKAGELFGSWLDADPAWGFGWIGWADCYLHRNSRAADFGRAEELLRAATASPVSGTGPRSPTRGGRKGGVRTEEGSRGRHARAALAWAALARADRAKGQGRTKWSVPVRQREKVEEVLSLSMTLTGELRLAAVTANRGDQRGAQYRVARRRSQAASQSRSAGRSPWSSRSLISFGIGPASSWGRAGPARLYQERAKGLYSGDGAVNVR